jgi:hypothetical protein
MSKDEYYNTPEARLDTVLGEQKKYFELLKHLKVEFVNNNITDISFQTWVLETYGIKMVLNGDHRITAEHYIVAQQKYLVCRLKYPGQN